MRFINKYSVFALISLLLLLLSINEGMFWDNVLFASKMGNHLFSNGLFNLYIPDSYDPGHPPFLAFILAIGWKLLGHKLWVSHMIMLPFVFGLLVQLYKFVGFYIKETKFQIAALALILADPTLSAQLVLVNPEVIQLFFLLLAINAILQERNKLLIIALCFLGIITFRGMMLCAGVFLFDLANHLIINKNSIKNYFNRKRITCYIIGSLTALAYVTWRLLVKGWLQTHPGSPWESLWHFASLKTIILNCITLSRWYLDFGRIVVMGFIAFFFLKNVRIIQDTKVKQLLLLSVCSVFVIVAVSLLSTNTFAHRYFIASYIALIMLSFVLLEKVIKYKKALYGLLLLGLLSGNLWVYPHKVAQGWDASLAHLPYFSLRKDAIQYMNNQGISVEQTASFFPNECKVDEVDLSGDTRSFSKFNGNNEYLFYSNVYNLSDEEYAILENKYIALKTFESCRISVILYKLKNQ